MLEIDLYNPRRGARNRSADASPKGDQIEDRAARTMPPSRAVSK
jgi:hypothetical protein